MHVSACICMSKYVCMHVEVRGQPWVLFLGNLPICFFETVSYSDLELADKANWSGSPRNLPASTSSALGLQASNFFQVCALRIKVGFPFLYGKWSVT